MLPWVPWARDATRHYLYLLQAVPASYQSKHLTSHSRYTGFSERRHHGSGTVPMVPARCRESSIVLASGAAPWKRCPFGAGVRLALMSFGAVKGLRTREERNWLAWQPLDLLTELTLVGVGNEN